MKIVHVVNSSKEGEGIVGIERNVRNLALTQQARGSSASLLISYPGTLAESCREHGIQVTVAADVEHADGENGRPAEMWTRALIGHLEGTGADVIHCHTLGVAKEVVPAGNQMGIPCVLTFNGPGPNGIGPLKQARKAGIRFLVICVSKAAYNEFRESGFTEDDVYYVPNGTEGVTVSPSLDERGPRQPNLISVGSLIRRKGTDNLILAMVELRRRLGDQCPRLYIYGDGDQSRYLREMVTALALDDSVYFCGFGHEILKICASTDILVMSSRGETGPPVILEAMSRGMPIVATDVGEVSDMIPSQQYGRVVPVDSLIPLTDAIESILLDVSEGRFDPELLIQRHRSLYTNERMAESLEAVYERAIQQASAVRD